MGVLCYCLVTIKKLAVFRCKYNSKNATICYVLFFKSKFYSSLFLIKDDIAKYKNIFEKTTFPKSIYFGFGIFFYNSTTIPVYVQEMADALQVSKRTLERLMAQLKNKVLLVV